MKQKTMEWICLLWNWCKKFHWSHVSFFVIVHPSIWSCRLASFTSPFFRYGLPGTGRDIIFWHAATFSDEEIICRWKSSTENDFSNEPYILTVRFSSSCTVAFWLLHVYTSLTMARDKCVVICRKFFHIFFSTSQQVNQLAMLLNVLWKFSGWRYEEPEDDEDQKFSS